MGSFNINLSFLNILTTFILPNIIPVPFNSFPHPSSDAHNYYVKPKGPYSIKKLKELTNNKLRVADTKRKLQNLMLQLYAQEMGNKCDKQRELVCSGRSVKEIAHYFEQKSTATTPVEDCNLTWTRHSLDRRRLNPTFTSLRSNSPLNRKASVSLTSEYSPRQDVNVHALWKDAMVRQLLTSRRLLVHQKNTTKFNSLKESIKARLMTCVLMLQYIL